MAGNVITESEWLRGGLRSRSSTTISCISELAELELSVEGKDNFPPWEEAFGNSLLDGDISVPASTNTATAEQLQASNQGEDGFICDTATGYMTADGDMEQSIEMLSMLRRARIELHDDAPGGGGSDDEEELGSGSDNILGTQRSFTFLAPTAANVSAMSPIREGCSDDDSECPSEIDESMCGGTNSIEDADDSLRELLQLSSRLTFSSVDGDADGQSLVQAETGRESPIPGILTPPRPRSSLRASVEAAPFASSFSGLDDTNDAGAREAFEGSEPTGVCDRLAFITGSPVVTPQRGSRSRYGMGDLLGYHAGMPSPTGLQAVGSDADASNWLEDGSLCIDDEDTGNRQACAGSGDAAAVSPAHYSSTQAGAIVRTPQAQIAPPHAGRARSSIQGLTQPNPLAEDVWTLSPALSPFSSLAQHISPTPSSGAAAGGGRLPARKTAPRVRAVSTETDARRGGTTSVDGPAHAGCPAGPQGGLSGQRLLFSDAAVASSPPGVRARDRHTTWTQTTAAVCSQPDRRPCQYRVTAHKETGQVGSGQL